jgi:prophage antirepressor-like protein
MSSILLAEAFEGQEVRAVEIAGEPWFVAADVVAVLRPECDPRNRGNYIACAPDEYKGHSEIMTLGGMQKMTVISEPGLYWVIARSDSPRAVPFQNWLYSEVLPSIRKTGRYAVEPEQERDPWADATPEQVIELALKAERFFRRNGTLDPATQQALSDRMRAAIGLKKSLAPCLETQRQLADLLQCSGVGLVDDRLVFGDPEIAQLHCARDGSNYVAIIGCSMAIRQLGKDALSLMGGMSKSSRFPFGIARCWFFPVERCFEVLSKNLLTAA